jgi:hypothetical protein
MYALEEPSSLPAARASTLDSDRLHLSTASKSFGLAVCSNNFQVGPAKTVLPAEVLIHFPGLRNAEKVAVEYFQYFWSVVIAVLPPS